ncbi:hypothetical protein PG996_007921 [Apiospora saccharicola]|uniref:Nephrocystin 3-like N-terminal domain-containing protein n=1 Tax=Apiospora saccharicola TaxID=335842 RepID=A0ABR1UWF8_9PEZI
MESVAALGVAAAAVQFFGVVVKATALCREIRDNAESATDHNRDLEASVRELQDVQAQLAHAAQSSQPTTRRRITDCLAKCYTDSDELRRLLEEVRGAGRNRSTLKNLCRAMKDRRRIEKLERSLLSKRDILHSVLQQETLRHNQAMSQAQNHREELEAKANADKFLQTLFFPEILERQSQIKDAAPGTLEWIFETEDTDVSGEDRATYLGTTQRPWDDLAAWLRNDNGVYWVNGKAGSGKSTLMAHVVDDPRTKRALDIWCGGRKCHILSYFFWRPGTDMQKNIVGLLRSLVYQICDQNPKRTQSLIKRLAIGTSKMHTWTERSLRKAFHEAIGIATWSWFCIFVDGLDEFDGNYGELVELISELEAHESVKFCVSSRPEVQLSKRLSSCRTLRLQDLNLSDIAQSTQQKLSRAGLGMNIEREPPHNYIAKRADGVFLWAALVTESLVRGFEAGDDEETLSKRIGTMPQGLNDLFKSMLSKVESVHRESLAFYLHALSIYMGPLDVLISIANLTASRAPSALSSLESFGIACKQTESQVIAQSAGLIEIGGSPRFYAEQYYEDSWNHADVWLKAECSTSPLKRERQTDPVQYPTTLIYEAKSVQWVHRSAYDFVWDHDNADRLKLSQTKPEKVLRELYRGYLTLITSSPSGNAFMDTSHTEARIGALQRSMAYLWKSYTMVTREATADLRTLCAAMDHREMSYITGTTYGNLENLPSDWCFWISCVDAGYWNVIFENLSILPLSTYALIAHSAFSSWSSPSTLEKLFIKFRDTLVSLFENSSLPRHIRLLWTSKPHLSSISYNSTPDRRESQTSLITEKYLATYVAETLAEAGHSSYSDNLDYYNEIVYKSGLFVGVASERPHLYMQAFAFNILRGTKKGCYYQELRPDAFRIICFPSGKTSFRSEEMEFETDSFVYFDTRLETTKYLSQYVRQCREYDGILRVISLFATKENLETCHRKIIDDFRANEQQLEATEKTRVVECLEAHLLDMLMSIRKEPDPGDDEAVSSSTDSDVENELTVNEDCEDQIGEQEAQLFDEIGSNRVVVEEDSSDWLTDDGGSTASSEEYV